MKQSQIDINGSQLIISTKKAPLFVRGILSILFVILVLLPVFAIFLSFAIEDRLYFGIVLSFIICWGVAFYLLRLILWNSAGREILTFNTNNILYVADYRLFQDGRKEIKANNFETEIIHEEEPNHLMGRLRFKNGRDAIDSVIKVTIDELEEIKKEIEKTYNKT